MQPNEVLLKTKFHVPAPRSSDSIVTRPRLTQKLDEALRARRQLTLISASAGYGKTTLLNEWISNANLDASADDSQIANRNVAWLSLDEEDNDPTRFLNYFIGALQTLQPDIGHASLALLSSNHQPQPARIESVLTRLINEIAGSGNLRGYPFAIVLDDYHLINSQHIHDALTFLLDHLPSNIQLVIASRCDPPLPLPRLRARNNLTEIRAADLRFTPDEVAAFLNNVMHLDLSPQEVAALETRTEGWIAGLQLAALAMQDEQDTSSFVEAFTGSHAYILDYLAEEVFQRQPAHIQSFLLQTSILERLSAALCEAVTGIDDAQSVLEYLQQSNLFIVPLDHDRSWYRYHHLFADFLRNRLQRTQPSAAHSAALHRRASAWHVQNQSSVDAVQHALSASDFETAAKLITTASTLMLRNNETTTLLSWLAALPDTLVQEQNELCIIYAWTLALDGQPDATEHYLKILDTKAQQREGIDPAVLDELIGHAAAVRVTLAIQRHDKAEVIKSGRKALAHLPIEHTTARTSVAMNLGEAYLSNDDLEEAARHLMASSKASTAINASQRVHAINVLAMVRTIQGRLHDALKLYKRALSIVRKQNVNYSTGSLHLGLGELSLEQNDLRRAETHLLKSIEVNTRSGLFWYLWQSYTGVARLRYAQGNKARAVAALKQAEETAYKLNRAQGIALQQAYQTRLMLAHGDRDIAARFLQTCNIDLSVDPVYPDTVTYACYARASIIEGSVDEALELLTRLYRIAQQAGRTASQIEVLLLQALAHQALHDLPAACESLKQALSLAQPQGYVRIFVDEGTPMRKLLTTLIQDKTSTVHKQPALALSARNGHSLPSTYRQTNGNGHVRTAIRVPVLSTTLTYYINKLLAAFLHKRQRTDGNRTQLPSPSHLPLLVESLSARELEVLQLLADGLSNQEIASALFIGISTVRWHNKNIYRKLDVNNRTQAAAQARRLGLIP